MMNGQFSWFRIDLLHKFVVPEFHEAEIGIQKKTMDSRFRGNDTRENMAKKSPFFA